MKLRNFLIRLGVGIVAGYYFYKENEKSENSIESIDRCRYKLISLGYNINDSYCLNLKENPYLIFYFTDNDKNYEVKYDKNNEKIIYIKGE